MAKTLEEVAVAQAKRNLAKVSQRIQDDLVERDRLILALRGKGLSLRELGELAGMSHVAVSKLLDRSG